MNTQEKILNYIKKYSPRTQKEICDNLGVDAGQVSNKITLLLALGKIKYTPGFYEVKK